jgi:hypothetical protein
MDNNDRGKCLTCEYWGGNVNFYGGNMVNAYRLMMVATFGKNIQE